MSGEPEEMGLHWCSGCQWWNKDCQHSEAHRAATDQREQTVVRFFKADDELKRTTQKDYLDSNREASKAAVDEYVAALAAMREAWGWE